MRVERDQMLSHYKLVEKIGEGGMGVVWKAKDMVLNRTVAIKVLPADLALDEERRRMFLDEARLVASVNHAHIVQVHELGREGDLDFIVMELVEGQPLHRLLRGKPLPPDKVAALGLQVAEGLARAHRSGLIHRDLKPANILVTPDDEVKIVDFGLATLFSREEMTSTHTRTLTDAPESRKEIAGTLPYMSPEQVRSERLDARSDIFSFGTVLYEMTTGQRPFTGPTPGEVAKEIQKGQPQPVHGLVPNVPLELDRIVEKAMAAHPSDRYQHMDDLAVDLRRLGTVIESGSSPSYQELRQSLQPARRWPKATLRPLLGAAIVCGLGAAGWLVSARIHRGGGENTDHTVLILPFEVRGISADADYVGRAFAEALAVNLAEAKDLKVLPVPPGEASRTNDVPPSRVAKQLAAGRVLFGALTRSDGATLASVSLVDADENRVVWGKQLDMHDAEMATLASTLAREVASQLDVSLGTLYDMPEIALQKSALAASPLVSEALGALRREAFRSAVAATERVVDAYPDVPEALALRVQATLEAWNRVRSADTESVLDRALFALERVDPEHPMVEVARGFMQSGKGQISPSIFRFTKLLSRDDLSSDVRAHVLMLRGWNEVLANQHDAAIRDLEEAVHLAPADGRNFAILAMTLQTAGRIEDALVRSRQAVALSPSDPAAFYWLGQVLRAMGREDEATTAAGRAFELAPNQNFGAFYAVSLLAAGRKVEALEVAHTAEALEEDMWGLYNFACFWALSGNVTEALRRLRRASELGFDAPIIRHDPDLISLQGNPEFEAIAAEIDKRAPLRP